MLFFKKKNQSSEIERPHKKVSRHPLTLPELDTQIKERIDIIQSEFTNGFSFIQNHPKTVTFFGSARTLQTEDDYKNAQTLASKISALGYTIITGGGPGIMEAANRGAFEGKGESVGFTIQLPMEQTTNPYLNSSLEFRYFFARKVALTYSAEAYVYFPGGFGTMDELFEILTLVQTNKIERVPIILFNTKFWKPLKKFIDDTLLATSKIDKEDKDLFIITDSIEEALHIVEKAPIRAE
jgi:uncharacterized protein (TIGR00730 family)